MPDDTKPAPLRSLMPRKELTKQDIAALLEDIKAALQGADALDYFDRMEHNHRVRFAWWPGQTPDGRRWPTPERLVNLMPGQTAQEARDIFPWRGAPDNRVRLVDSVIREHNALQQLALQRRQQHIGPRDLSPDADPQAAAALWGQVDDYYADLTKREWRRATAQWADIAKEYGCGGLFVGWKEDTETVPREISAEQLQEIIEGSAVEAARQNALEAHLDTGGTEEDFPDLSAEETFLIQSDAGARLQDMMLDAKQQKILADKLLEIDADMPRDEALRVAKALKLGEPVKYFAVSVGNRRPVYIPLTYGVNWLFPPTATTDQECEWHVITEWVGEAELKARTLSPHEPYDAAAVDAVLKQPGKAVLLEQILSGRQSNAWIFSGGNVRNGLDNTALEDSNKHRFQILHVYYRACAVGNAPALYHTVVSGHAPESALFHEVCGDAAARFPVHTTLSQIEVPYLLAAEGYGEQSATDQNEVKMQRDARGAEASLRIKPPLKVPLQQSGGRVDWRPGVQFPTRQTAGMGIEVMNTGTDTRGSQEVELTTLDSFNDYWKRGGKVDPEIKLAFNQMVVSNFLGDVAAAVEARFKLIQQYSPQNIRASFAGGLAVNLNTTREEIQGMVAVELDFDVAEMNPETMSKRMKAVTELLGVDNGGWLNRNQLLKAITPGLLPSWYKTLVNDPQKQAEDETADEQQQNANILAGTQFDEASSYREGLNHELRQEVMKRIYGVQLDPKGMPLPNLIPNGANGQFSRAQRLFSEDHDVQARVMNRFAFHARQLKQDENAITGRTQVENVTVQG